MPSFESVKYIHKKLLHELRKAANNPNPLYFIKAFVKFFMVCGIAFFGLTLILSVLFIFVIAPFLSDRSFGTKGTKSTREFEFKMKKDFHGGRNDLSMLKSEVMELKKMYKELAGQIFWTQNQKLYSHEFPNYKVNLSYVEPAEGRPVKNTKFEYDLTICRKSDVENCLYITTKEGEMKSTWNEDIFMKQPEAFFGFDGTEHIMEITAEAYSLEGITEYVFIGNVTTSSAEYPFVIYPSGLGDNTYYFVEKISMTQTDGIEIAEESNKELKFIYNQMDPVTKELELKTVMVRINEDGSVTHSLE